MPTIIPLYPPAQQRQEPEYTLTAEDVKNILYAFARDYEHRRKIEPPMRADALKKFIASLLTFETVTQ